MTDFKGYSLDQWLHHIQNQHWRTIDLELDRIKAVWKKLGGKTTELVIAIAGTNGKGSSVAMIESVIRNAGLRTGSYTSPHLVRYNERICIDGTPVNDQLITDALFDIETAREEIPLTYFEFSTLCALMVFMEQDVDAVILETGMGGRLDAVNMIDNDIALITSIGLDHQQWLGSDREKIGAEKAGIIKPQRLAVCSDPKPPDTISKICHSVDAFLLQLGEDFEISENPEDGSLTWSSDHRLVPSEWRKVPGLKPPFYGPHQANNLAGVVATLALISERIGLSSGSLVSGLENINLPGRTQIVCDHPLIILDVAHNADSARQLAAFLEAHPVTGDTFAVTAILKDKALEHIFSWVIPHIDAWYLASLEGDRGQTASELAEKLSHLHPDMISFQFHSPVEAFSRARLAANKIDRIVVFGSFYTVGDIIESLEQDSYLV